MCDSMVLTFLYSLVLTVFISVCNCASTQHFKSSSEVETYLNSTLVPESQVCGVCFQRMLKWTLLSYSNHSSRRFYYIYIFVCNKHSSTVKRPRLPILKSGLILVMEDSLSENILEYSYKLCFESFARFVGFICHTLWWEQTYGTLIR